MDDKLTVLEEAVYNQQHTLETLLNLLIKKGFFTKQELLESMEGDLEDLEEVGFEADRPRDVE